MDQQLIYQAINGQEKTPERISSSNKLGLNLTQEEGRIIDLKYKSKQFARMGATEIISQVEILLLKIHVITGWQIPELEFKDILIEQVCKKIVETYPNINVDEVEYAFRNKGAEVKDWGKNINLSLFDEVILPYLQQRHEVSKIEEQMIKPIELGGKKDLTDSEMQEWVNEWIKDFKQLKSILLIPTILYDWLTEKGEIELTNKEKNILLHETAVSIRESSLSDDPQELANFQQMKQQGYFVGQEIQRLKDIAKKAAVFNYLQKKST